MDQKKQTFPPDAQSCSSEPNPIKSVPGPGLSDLPSGELSRRQVPPDEDALRQEISALSALMDTFGVSFSDAAAQAPRQEKALRSCIRAAVHAAVHRELLDSLLQTKKLPFSQLARGSGVSRWTLMKHRKYLLVMLLIETDDFPLLREHLKQGREEKGGLSV